MVKCPYQTTFRDPVTISFFLVPTCASDHSQEVRLIQWPELLPYAPQPVWLVETRVKRCKDLKNFYILCFKFHLPIMRSIALLIPSATLAGGGHSSRHRQASRTSLCSLLGRTASCKRGRNGRRAGTKEANGILNPKNQLKFYQSTPSCTFATAIVPAPKLSAYTARKKAEDWMAIHKVFGSPDDLLHCQQLVMMSSEACMHANYQPPRQRPTCSYQRLHPVLQVVTIVQLDTLPCGLTSKEGMAGFALSPSCTAVLSYKGLGVSAGQPSYCTQSATRDSMLRKHMAAQKCSDKSHNALARGVMQSSEGHCIFTDPCLLITHQLHMLHLVTHTNGEFLRKSTSCT